MSFEDNKPNEPVRSTMPPEDANQRLIRHALQQSAEATESLNKLLPNLATKLDLDPLDRGIGMVLSRVDATDERLDTLNATLTQQLGIIAQAIEGLRHATMSAIDIATDAKRGGNGHDPEPWRMADPDETTQPDLKLVRGSGSGSNAE